MAIDLNPVQTAAGFSAEKTGLRYVKGWPERSPSPYRLYQHGRYIAAFPTLAALLRNVNNRIASAAR